VPLPGRRVTGVREGSQAANHHPASRGPAIRKVLIAPKVAARQPGFSRSKRYLYVICAGALEWPVVDGLSWPRLQAPAFRATGNGRLAV
jgi:hypothetical protein